MSKDHNYIQFAFNSKNQRVSIYDVPFGENTDCHCRLCGEPLGAKNKNKKRDTVLRSNQKVPHFYHISGSSCSGETIVHILAKEVLQESKKLLFRIEKVDAADSHLRHDFKEVNFDDVYLEERIWYNDKYIQPDAIAVIGKRDLFVEFSYSHSCDLDKKELIRENKQPCVEIDINPSDIDWNEFETEEQIKDRMTRFLHSDGFLNHYWIYNSKYPDRLKVSEFAEKDLTTENLNHQCNEINKNQKSELTNEDEEEDNLYYQLLEKRNDKLCCMMEYLNVNHPELVEKILSYEKRMDFLDGRHFETIDKKVVLKRASKELLISFTKQNSTDWIYLKRNFQPFKSFDVFID